MLPIPCTRASAVATFRLVRTWRACSWGLGVILIVLSSPPLLSAQSVANNPYRAVYGWEQLPEGRVLGVVSGIQADPDGEHVWILERCGANQCAGSELHPIHKFDWSGNLIQSVGAGLFAWPHGFHVDLDGNLWVTEGAPENDARGAAGFAVGKGHQVFKLSPQGEVLMTLGVAGQPGDDERHFNGPAGVLVAPNGEIWVADGHRGGNNRIVKFAADGSFIEAWGGGVGSESRELGRFDDPHDLAIDARGRLFVADRGNNRIQIFDQEGALLEVWTQFGRPSGIHIDDADRIYVADGMSDANWNPGWERGIRIGDAGRGWVTSFIPDAELAQGSGMEFLSTDPEGSILAGEVGRQRLVRYVRIRP